MATRRWRYFCSIGDTVVVFALSGNAGLQSTDSVGLLTNAHEFATPDAFRLPEWPAMACPPGYALPLFPALLDLCAMFFSAWAPRTDPDARRIHAGTCLLIYDHA